MATGKPVIRFIASSRLGKWESSNQKILLKASARVPVSRWLITWIPPRGRRQLYINRAKCQAWMTPARAIGLWHWRCRGSSRMAIYTLYGSLCTTGCDGLCHRSTRGCLPAHPPFASPSLSALIDWQTPGYCARHARVRRCVPENNVERQYKIHF